VSAIIGGQLTMVPAETAFSGPQNATDWKASGDLCSLERIHYKEDEVTKR